MNLLNGKKLFVWWALALSLLSCSGGSSSTTDPGTTPGTTTGGGTTTSTTAVFAKGADVSWLTQMEKEGKKFYDASGNEKECMTLLKSLGMNAIRLRVWVNPTDGWCNKEDVLAKAKRANALGMRIMIDFHYSDSWADPSKQPKPAAWKSLGFADLKTAVATHTTEVLTLLKNSNITPEWVQVGNETSNGMLWDDGGVWVWDTNPSNKPNNMSNYAALNNAAYAAVKGVFSSAKVIVHLDNGYDADLYSRFFSRLKSAGGKWDVIGMSLYPSYDSGYTASSNKSSIYSSFITKCIANMNNLIGTYQTPVMICETGMPWDDATNAKGFLTALLTAAKAVSNNNCLGVFYWEPEGFVSWSKYTLGAFDNSGKPTAALDAFAN
jgi:arabinogalactan endo-1,4-beta-galactosidase